MLVQRVRTEGEGERGWVGGGGNGCASGVGFSSLGCVGGCCSQCGQCFITFGWAISSP